MDSPNREQAVGQQYFVLPPGEKTRPKMSIKLPSYDVYNATAGLNDTEFIRISATQSNFLVEKNLRLETQKCYPGFIFDGNTCVCDLSIPGLERYVKMFGVFIPAAIIWTMFNNSMNFSYFIIDRKGENIADSMTNVFFICRCSKGRYLYLKEGYWGGIVNGVFVTNICPRGYCQCTRKEGTTGCFYDFKKPDDFCLPGRDSLLCGRCKDGLNLSLRPTKCIDCEGTGLVLALSMLGVLVFTLLVIYFNPNIPTDLRGILFYVQVLPFLFKPNDRVGDIVTTISGVTDLGRPTEYPVETCAVPGLGNLGTTTLNYVTPAEVIIILFIIFIVRRFLHFNRSKPFQCFLVLIVLMYKYIVETSFALIHCVDIGGVPFFLFFEKVLPPRPISLVNPCGSRRIFLL